MQSGIFSGYKGLFNRASIACAITGLLLLAGLSFIQKIIAGFNPFVIKAYIIPVIFGGVSGLLTGIYINKLKIYNCALHESEEKYRSMMESMGDASYICSSDFRIEYANPTMLEKIGGDSIGKHCYSAIHGLDARCSWCCHKEVMDGKPTDIEVVSPKDNRSYLVSSTPVCHSDGKVSKMSVFKDITDIRNMEKQLQQSQKMEAIGTLAGGIAHDFNNILAAVIGYTELLQLSLDKMSDEYQYSDQIMQAGNRAKDLVRQILVFSRQTDHQLEPIGLKSIVDETLRLLRSSLPATIKIKKRVTGTPHILGDSTHIHQILMNLCTNAGFSMKEKGGVLLIELDEIELNEKLISDKITLLPGNYVRLCVSDTGHGIDPDILDRIFDPFYTTKDPGEGTGMGLSVVHGIVESYNGEIYVYSEKGAGTTFRIFLPALDGDVEDINKEDNGIESGDERILLVDDEPMLVQMGTTQLETLGYKVTAATSSKKAVEMFRNSPENYDLVITDMTMPEMTGDELLREIKMIKPEIPVILCTGFSNLISPDAGLEGVDALLMKPVIMREMAKAVRMSLDENPAKSL